MNTFTAEQAIKLIIVKASAYWREQLPDVTLAIYAQQLRDHIPEDVEAAYQSCMQDPSIKRMPLPSEIRARISGDGSDLSMARLISANILSAIARFGSHRTEDAHMWLGEAAWEVVKRQGGWMILCSDINESNKTTYQAQLRDLALSVLEASKRGTLNKAPELPQPAKEPTSSSERLTVPLGDILKRALSYQGDTQGRG